LLTHVVVYYEQVIAKKPPEFIVDALRGYLDLMDVKLLFHAIDIAVSENILSWPYIEGVLENWKSDRIFTFDDYELHERERKNNKAARRTGIF
jgi:DnaD/phage-associated family protein